MVVNAERGSSLAVKALGDRGLTPSKTVPYTETSIMRPKEDFLTPKKTGFLLLYYGGNTIIRTKYDV